MLASPVLAGWEKVAKTEVGNTIYVDFDRIRKDDKYVYYRALEDYFKKSQYGWSSTYVYSQIDCNLFRIIAEEYNND